MASASGVVMNGIGSRTTELCILFGFPPTGISKLNDVCCNNDLVAASSMRLVALSGRLIFECCAERLNSRKISKMRVWWMCFMTDILCL